MRAGCACPYACLCLCASVPLSQPHPCQAQQPQVFFCGTMLVEIVPAEAEYLVRAQINPQDIADVQPGQVARISLSAYDPSRYGVVMGVVRRVASNTTQPENAMPFYETIIAIPEVAFTKSPEQPVITSGMPLQVDILGGKRTVMEYIMTPIQKSLATAFRET